MATIATLAVNLIARTSAFEKGMYRSRGSLHSFQGAAMAAQTSAMNLFRNLGIAAGAGAIMKLAADAKETQSMFEAVYKEQSKAAEKFALGLSGSIGRSVTSVKESMANFQDTFVPLGFARERARELSEELTRLVYDVASFKNQRPEDAARDFQSAIVGNHETVRKYGIIITQAALNQELLRMGIEKGIKNATSQAKVQARLNIIMQGTTDAQGDAIRTAGSLSNRMRALKDQTKEAAIVLGTIFVGTMEDVLANMSEVLELTKEWIKVNQAAIKGWVIFAAKVGIVMVVLPRLISLLHKVKAAILFLASHPVVAGLMVVGSAIMGAAGWFDTMNEEFVRTIDLTNKHADALNNIREKYLEMDVSARAASISLAEQAMMEMEAKIRKGEREAEPIGVGAGELQPYGTLGFEGFMELQALKREYEMLKQSIDAMYNSFDAPRVDPFTGMTEDMKVAEKAAKSFKDEVLDLQKSVSLLMGIATELDWAQWEWMQKGMSPDMIEYLTTLYKAEEMLKGRDKEGRTGSLEVVRRSLVDVGALSMGAPKDRTVLKLDELKLILARSEGYLQKISENAVDLEME